MAAGAFFRSALGSAQGSAPSRRLVAALVASLVVAGVVWTAVPAAAAVSCATSGPAGGAYSAAVCITAPGDGSTITGSTAVTVSISVTGTNPGVQKVVFTLNGSDLLWDFQSPYAWTLDSTRWVDGAYTLRASAIMRDGFITDQATATLNFGDGYENCEPMERNNWYGQPGLPGEYGQFSSISDPAVGDHEYTGTDISGYRWYWNNVPHYYSYDADGWHFVSLDNISKFIGNTPTNSNYVAETKWLSKDLASNKKACTLVYYHEPVYNVGPEGSPANGPPIWQILAQHNVTLVLNGHDHDYQRWTRLDANGNPSPTGVMEFVAGNGGHGLQSQVTTDSRLVASDF